MSPLSKALLRQITASGSRAAATRVLTQKRNNAFAAVAPASINVFEGGLLGNAVKADVDGLLADAGKLKSFAAKRVKSNGFTPSFAPEALGFGHTFAAPTAAPVPSFAPPPVFIRPVPDAKLDEIHAALGSIRVPLEKTAKLANGWCKLELSPREVLRMKQALADHNGAGLEFVEGTMPASAIP